MTQQPEFHEQIVQLGWDGDHGFGELLLARLLSGALDVLYEPVAVLDEDELDELRTSGGQELTVIDADEDPRCNVRVTDVFETTWGDPDPRLVAGEGYGDDAAGWRRANEAMLGGALEETGEELDADTRLIVQRVQVTDVWNDD
ncbi:MAG: hypothetical protein R3343_04270 [Nitriliruptorales bacterium]|nr:hypothetical protein [Nitriliruptorales bacterium]